MSERAVMKAAKMELEEKQSHILLTIEALRQYMQELLYVLVEPDALEGKKILMLAMQLNEKTDELAKNKEKLALIARELGD